MRPINWNDYITIAINDLSQEGVKFAELSKTTKGKASKLEHVMTMHAYNNNLPKFIYSVRAWRDVMLKDWKERKSK